jgi:uncharacterized protein YcgI (DUF1989 family)
MEYLSLPHTRASSYKLVPEVDDTLLTNLRNPIITLVEDSSPGAHDTLTAACDANLYTALGVDKPAEHGSCAENLVLALKELNESAGLKGAKAVGADISVNIAPTPLHLFMVTPVSVPSESQPSESGAKGATLSVSEPKGKKRGFVRFRAERDVVVVFSACPMDVGPQNGGRCMAANFMVEEPEADGAATDAPKTKGGKDGKKTPPKKLNAGEKKNDSAGKQTDDSTKNTKDQKQEKEEESKPKKLPAPNNKEEDIRAERQNPQEPQEDEQKQADDGGEKNDVNKSQEEPQEKLEEKTEEKTQEKPEGEQKPKNDAPSQDAAKPKKKPKKLQVRSKQ